MWQSDDGVTIHHLGLNVHKINIISYLLDLLVDNDADSMLGYIVDTSCLAMVALMRHTSLNGTCALKEITYSIVRMIIHSNNKINIIPLSPQHRNNILIHPNSN